MTRAEKDSLPGLSIRTRIETRNTGSLRLAESGLPGLSIRTRIETLT